MIEVIGQERPSISIPHHARLDRFRLRPGADRLERRHIAAGGRHVGHRDLAVADRLELAFQQRGRRAVVLGLAVGVDDDDQAFGLQ